MDFFGFIEMVDAVGGIDVDRPDDIDDPDVRRLRAGRARVLDRGRASITSTAITALAYARARKGAGESDFTRAARQQQVLVALRNAVTDGRWQPAVEAAGLLDAVGETIRTDVPVERLPELAAIVDEIDDDAVTRAVIRHPLVKSRRTEYGSSLIPNLEVDPGDGRQAVPGARRGAPPLADPEADGHPEAERDPEALTARLSRRTPPGDGASGARPRPDARSRSSPRRSTGPAFAHPGGSPVGSKIGS